MLFLNYIIFIWMLHQNIISTEGHKNLIKTVKKKLKKLIEPRNDDIAQVVDYETNEERIKNMTVCCIDISDKKYFISIVLEINHYFNPITSDKNPKKLTIPIYTTENRIVDGMLNGIARVLENEETGISLWKKMIEKTKTSSEALEILGSKKKFKLYTEKQYKSGFLLTYLDFYILSVVIDKCIYYYEHDFNIWMFFRKNWPNYSTLDMKNEKCIYIAVKEKFVYSITEVVDEVLKLKE
ncbi:uncharacterized protein LOC126906024 [Daktulosphaira vitifoliae]|uniref:uncharacterized protein LOC126906024 n=1 Tax=Daktulosphaira vitifoliae TaxID=58002 RepID=UPI0021AA6142|nr:uncharacterized protein LOC126906024 [Daktulosphaira vitifoliae]XP_050542203.1 uncharacterized protein LOC126906024 [Daktulosphaira vitifoliae]